MKPILLINLFAIVFATNAISQQCATNIVQSPVVKKPMAATASVNCNSVTVQWQGNANEKYQLTVTVKDATTDKKLKTFSTNTYKQNGDNYTATISVNAGTKLSWSVQAITVVNNRTLSSYPLRGKEIVVPSCTTTSAIAATDQNESMASAKDKLNVAMYPNPVQSILHLQLTGSDAGKKVVRVVDIYGRTVATLHSDQNMIQVNTANLIQGLYIVQIETESGKVLFAGKFTKM